MSEPGSEPLAEVRLISAGHQGKLSASGHDDVPVRVFERGSDVLMLVILLDGDPGIEPDPTEPALLEYSSGHGLVRLHGEAEIEQRDLIRFRASHDAEVLQRREFVRIDAPQPVVLEGDRLDGPLQTHAVDVSGGGMLLRGLDSFQEGHRLRFSLELGDDQPPVAGSARVVRTGDDGQRGVVFEAISSTERQRLIHFIFDRQRAARAKTRDGARRLRRKA
jgi:hypothetical protein